MTRSSAIAVLSALTLWPGLVSAQEQKVTLPDEVVTVLVEGPGLSLTGRYTLFTGTPPNFPTDFLPAGIDVKGGATSGTFTVLVAYAGTSADAALVVDETRLMRTGWFAGGVPAGVFTGQPVAAPKTFCREAEFVLVATVPARSGGHFLRISVPKDAPRPCVARPVRMITGANVPALTPPSGAKMLGSSGGSGGHGTHALTRIQADQSPAELLDHFLRQLSASGWALDGKRLEADWISVARLRSTRDRNVSGTLVVAASGDDLFDVTLRISPESIPAPPRMNPVR